MTRRKLIHLSNVSNPIKILKLRLWTSNLRTTLSWTRMEPSMLMLLPVPLSLISNSPSLAAMRLPHCLQRRVSVMASMKIPTPTATVVSLALTSTLSSPLTASSPSTYSIPFPLPYLSFFYHLSLCNVSFISY